jgi:hypothetical protein
MKVLVAALLLLAACSKKEEPKPAEPSAPPAASAPAASEPASSLSKDFGSSEKEKALSHPYPNDLGPASLPDEYVASLGEHKKGYELLLKRCAQCHSAARPLNSRFVEVPEAELARLKKEQPALLADASVRQVETGVWNRYVKRMMSKPGCEIAKAEGKLIWQFLAADSKRKLGENAASWEAHRKKLLAEFKAKHPARYDELKAAGDL